jgi:hypothetical protein
MARRLAFLASTFLQTVSGVSIEDAVAMAAGKACRAARTRRRLLCPGGLDLSQHSTGSVATLAPNYKVGRVPCRTSQCRSDKSISSSLDPVQGPTNGRELVEAAKTWSVGSGDRNKFLAQLALIAVTEESTPALNPEGKIP